MRQQIITIYCLCADFLAPYGHKNDPQERMTDAEARTVLRVASAFFVGNQERSRIFLQEHGYSPAMLRKIWLNRRLRALPDTLWQALFAALAEYAGHTNQADEYIVESCLVPFCDTIRIRRSRTF